MKRNHITGIILAIALVAGASSAAFAKKLPWPYGDRAMNNLAVQIYAQQQAQRAYGAYANPYANPYVNQYYNPYTYTNPYVNPYNNMIGSPWGYGYY